MNNVANPRYRLFVTLALCAATAESRAEVHFSVGQSGQYATVQAAVDAVPAGNTERHIIDILPGTYAARVKVPSNKPFITLRGQDPLTTILAFNETTSSLPNESTNHASTVVQGADFIAENLTFQNTFGPGTQALAIYAKADRLIFNNCRFLGYQDTLRAEGGRQYYYNNYVEGSVDFIYGKGTAYFENTTIFSKASGYLTAQAREAAAETNGFVFKNSTINGSSGNNSVYLGRPWQAYSRAIFIDTKMSAAVRPQGWSVWSGNNNHLTSYFAEYNSMDLAGNPIDVSQRPSWSYQLTAQQAEAYSKANWLGGSDGWNPVILSVNTLPGDYNGDHVVDAADYTEWRDALGQNTTLPNETATPGIVDQADYDAWKNNFGAVGSGTGASSWTNAVPEPATWLLVLLSCTLPPSKRVRIG